MEREKIIALLREGRPYQELYYQCSYWFQFDGEEELISPSEMAKALRERRAK